MAVRGAPPGWGRFFKSSHQGSILAWLNARTGTHRKPSNAVARVFVGRPLSSSKFNYRCGRWFYFCEHLYSFSLSFLSRTKLHVLLSFSFFTLFILPDRLSRIENEHGSSWIESEIRVRIKHVFSNRIANFFFNGLRRYIASYRKNWKRC